MDWIQLVVQTGALGLLAVVIFRGMKSFDCLARALEKNTLVLARLAAMLLQHDATVRGVNPETLGTTEDLMRRVLDG
jgi:hypothetical protein